MVKNTKTGLRRFFCFKAGLRAYEVACAEILPRHSQWITSATVNYRCGGSVRV